MKFEATLDLRKEEVDWLKQTATRMNTTVDRCLESIIFLVHKNEEDEKKIRMTQKERFENQ